MTMFDGFHLASGATVQRASEDPDIRATNRCRQVGDVHFCAAGRMSLGFEGAGDTSASGVGLLFMTHKQGAVGLSLALTPKAMRSLAGTLERMASDIEATAERQAAAALDKAAGK